MRHREENIILIGFMGSGKTTFGRWISKNKNYQFCDTDQYIEEQKNRTIKDNFANQGEEAFRDMETAALKELCDRLKNTVVSVGGGLPVREENRKLLKQLGMVVYLRAAEDELVKRLSHDTSRPLLAGGDLKSKIQNLMSAREALYIDAADVVIDTDHMSFEEMYDVISKASEEIRQ